LGVLRLSLDNLCKNFKFALAHSIPSYSLETMQESGRTLRLRPFGSPIA
jgi:hypothetical protein